MTLHRLLQSCAVSMLMWWVILKGAVMEEAGWIFLFVVGVMGLVWFVVHEYLDYRHSQKFWREIHMNAGRVVRGNKRRTV